MANLATKPYVIGIDMGGTNTAFGIVDARGNVIASDSIKTGKHSDINDYIDELYTEITRIIVANDAVDKINGIGIGAPNANYYTRAGKSAKIKISVTVRISAKCLGFYPTPSATCRK